MYPREAQLFHLESAASWQRALTVTKHKVIQFSYPVDLATLKLLVWYARTCAIIHYVTSLHVRTMLALWYMWGVKNKSVMQSVPLL